MKGLIGRSSEAFLPGSGIWIVPCNGIHTVGMRYAIDVAYLDSQKRVLKSYHRLKPYRFGALMLRARSVLEFPAGTLERTHTEVGDLLEICPTEKLLD